MADDFKPSPTMNRQEMLKAAVYFLQNPQLSGSPLGSKRQFLLDKGLLEEEIEDAINLALNHAANNQLSSQGSNKWNFLLILGLCYGGYSLYNFYTTYQETKRMEKQRKLEESAQKKPVYTLKDIMDRMLTIQRTLDIQKSSLSTEIQSVKSLLLSHNQFTGPPTIPAWQLNDDEEKSKPDSPIAPNPV